MKRIHLNTIVTRLITAHLSQHMFYDLPYLMVFKNPFSKNLYFYSSFKTIQMSGLGTPGL